MRIVRTGTKDKLYRLQQKDLPPDGSLKGSFLKWVDLSGFDLSGYDMTNVDTVDCVAHNVTLPEGKTHYWMSRRTSLAGATIPTDISDLHHDAVLEVMRHHTAPPGSLAETTINWVIDHVGASYSNSWKTSIWYQVMMAGLTREQFREHLTYAFAGYPKCLQRLKYELSLEDLTKDPPQQPEDRVRLDGVGDWPKSQWNFTFATADRWLLSRRAESALDIRHPALAPWRACFLQLEPFVIARASPDSLLSEAERWIYALYGVLV